MWAGESQRQVKAADQHMNNQGAQGAQSAAWDEAHSSGTPTVGWFVRRSALWMGIMIVSVVMACTLYALASQVGAGDARGVMPKIPTPEIKV
jgi:hypothetical protein